MAILKSIYYRSTFPRELRPSLSTHSTQCELREFSHGSPANVHGHPHPQWRRYKMAPSPRDPAGYSRTQDYAKMVDKVIQIHSDTHLGNLGSFGSEIGESTRKNTIPRHSNSSFFHLRYCPSCASDKDLSSSRNWKADLATNARFILMPRRALWWQPM